MRENIHPGHLNFSRLVMGDQPVAWTGTETAAGLAWVDAAVQEGVAPLLYWHFHRGRWPEAIPTPVREALTRAYYNTLAQNTLLLLELAKVLDLFAQADIPVMVLKGGALADGYYDDIGLRPMGDLDVLIPQAKLEAAFEIVRGLGYTPYDVEIIPGARREVWHHESWRGGPGKQLGLELHWHLIAGPADDRNVPVDWFWTQTEWREGRSVLAGMNIPQMNPTAHLLYLAAHLSLKHGGNDERLIWFYDADRLIRAGQVDWAQFIRQAQGFGWGAPARYIVEGAALRFGTPLPEKVLPQLAEGDGWQAFLQERQAKTGDVPRMRQTWQRLKHFPVGLRLRWGVALIFPSPAYLHWRYRPHPVWTWPVYYLYRWVDIARDGWKVMVEGGKRG
jgi:hypothetical protein